MDINKAFDRTLKAYRIKASEMSASSGVPETDISKFRNGHQEIRVPKLEMLLNALPPNAKDYFWLLFKSEDSDIVPSPHLCLAEKTTPYRVSKESKEAIAV